MKKLDRSLAALVLTGLTALVLTAGCGLLGSDASKGIFGSENAFALDSSGFAHAVYTANSSLRYATNKSGSWQTETIAAGRLEAPSLAVDSAGHCHVGYYDATNRAYVYTTNATGAWAAQTVQTGLYSVYSHALALDGSSSPQIVLTEVMTRDYSSCLLAYATMSGGSWSVAYPLGTATLISKAAFALDAAGHPNILYLNNSSHDVILARYAGGVWTAEAVANIGENIDYTREILALTVTPADRFSLVYNDHTYASTANNILTFASREAAAAWQTKNIDLYADYASLATDSGKKSHLLYRRGERLQYATDLTGSWTQEVLFIDTGKVGIAAYGDVSVCLDSSGKLQGIYYEDTSRQGSFDPIMEGRLQYFTNRTGTWERTVVDEGT